MYCTRDNSLDWNVNKAFKKYIEQSKKLAPFLGGRGTSLGQPVKSGTIQGTGYGDAEGHKGVDIFNDRGTPILAAADGVIDYAEYGHTSFKRSSDTAFSVRIKLDTPVVVNGISFPYIYHTHLQENLTWHVPQNSSNKPRVKKGDVIGYMGHANADHLHISVAYPDGSEGGHTNTMNAFGWTHNQNLPTVGNAEAKPTTATGTTEVVPINASYSGSTSSSSSDNSSTSSTSTNSSNSGNRLLNKLSSIMDTIGGAFNNPIAGIIDTIHSAWDNSGSTSNNTSTNTNTGTSSSSGSITSDDLGRTLSTEEAYHRDPRSFSKITSQQLKDAIVSMNSGSYLQNYADDIIRASEKTGLDPRFITAFAIQESGWDGSEISRNKNNYFGIGAIDSDPYNGAYTFSSAEEGFTEGAQWILENYIEAGQNTLWKFNNAENGWHNYNSGGTDGMRDYAKLYSQFINATGGAGRGGRGTNSKLNVFNRKFNRLKIKNPFEGRSSYFKSKNKNIGSVNPIIPTSSYSDIPVNSDIRPVVKKYATITPITKNKKSYGGRGVTPIPSTAALTEALASKSNNSIINTINNAIKTSSNRSPSTNNTSSIDNLKLDEGNKISTAMLTVLKTIASTLERIEKNSAMRSTVNNVSYLPTSSNTVTDSYKNDIINSIIAGN